MSNSFRYYNLSKMAGLGQYNGLGISWDAKDVVDLFSPTLADYGNITAGLDDFPHKGAGLEHELILTNAFALGDLQNYSVRDWDFGSIA